MCNVSRHAHSKPACLSRPIPGKLVEQIPLVEQILGMYKNSEVGSDQQLVLCVCLCLLVSNLSVWFIEHKIYVQNIDD